MTGESLVGLPERLRACDEFAPCPDVLDLASIYFPESDGESP